MDKKEEFLIKLRELMKEYNANIYFNCSADSDLWGINDERIEISLGDSIIKSVDGYGFSSSDLLKGE